MKVRILRKRLGRTIGLPNFSSVSFQEEAEIEVGPDESEVEAEKALYGLVARMLQKDIKRFREGSKRKPNDQQADTQSES